MEALVVVNSSAHDYAQAEMHVFPYFKVFGLTYQVVDRATEQLDHSALQYALLIIAHPDINAQGLHRWTDDEKAVVRACLANGVGIVSFDPDRSLYDVHASLSWSTAPADVLRFASSVHYITSLHPLGETVELKNRVNPDALVNVPCLAPPALDESTVLLHCGEWPYLIAGLAGRGKIVQWMGSDWMVPQVRGPVWGLDDLLWRSLVWAAKKPFMLRTIPNFATLRIDDCVGDHGEYANDPFRWVEIAHEYGFKPWLGFFYDDISTLAAQKLEQLVMSGQATAQFHGIDLFGIVYRNANHSTEGIRAAVKSWFEQHNVSFPLSSYFLPHAYDLARAALPVLREDLGVKYTGLAYPLDTGGGVGSRSNAWLRMGPYRDHLMGTDGTPWTGESCNRPIYYAGWLKEAEDFFNVLSEIRDVNGYEWFRYGADNRQYTDTTEAIIKGCAILRRCYESKILGNLFTHEDSWRGEFIANLTPDAWREIIASIVSNLSQFQPRFVTLDDAAAYALSLYESGVTRARYIEDRRVLHMEFRGSTICDTEVTVFDECRGAILERTYDIAYFTDGCSTEISMDQAEFPDCESLFTTEFPVAFLQTAETLNLGTKFYALTTGSIEQIKFYKTGPGTETRTLQLWDVEAERLLLGPIEITFEGAEGWQEYTLESPLPIPSGRELLVSVSTPKETPISSYAICKGMFASTVNRAYLFMDKGSGVCSFSLNEMPRVCDSFSSYFTDIVFRAEARIHEADQRTV
ncbi:DUF4082 domain-containing protein [Paenibacillus athensensis]|nr:DUF4082 domain-containing protein [Paenibacillus athensensis]MCD1259376.1 DUF4082 domain-containing protein [Paenibacillus athensensis]